jgi:hypothetical protein
VGARRPIDRSRWSIKMHGSGAAHEIAAFAWLDRAYQNHEKMMP